MPPSSPKQKRPSPSAPSKPPATASFPQWPWALVLIVVTFWIYWPALQGDWLWDDTTDITGNDITQSTNGLWSIWFAPGSQLDYYPVKATVQWLQWHLWGRATLGYHLTNIVLHLLNAFLVWRLFSRLGLRLAGLGACLFAVHPVMVESVAWIAELKNTLSLAFFLPAMIHWIDFTRDGRRRDYFLSIGFYLLAMLTKPSMVMFPIVILLYSWWRQGVITRRDLKASAPFFLISLIIGLITLSVGGWYQEIHHSGSDPVPMTSLAARVAMGGLALAFYFSKAVLPLNLAPVYPHWPVDPPSPMQFLPWLILAGLIAFLWMRRNDWGRPVLLGLGFFILMLVPFLGLSAISYMTFTWVMDHFLYVPILGLIGLAIAALERLGRQISPMPRLALWILVGMTLVLSTIASRGYAALYLNQETLWNYAVQRNPDAWIAHANLGETIGVQGRTEEACAHFAEAIRLHPQQPETQSNWGAVLNRSGHPGEAIPHYQEALRLRPNYAEAHFNWGNALMSLNRLSEAAQQYEEALQLDPRMAQAANNWGNVLLLAGRPWDAITQFQEAIRLQSDFADAHNNLGNALLKVGQANEACVQYAEAARLAPKNAETRYNWGNARMALGDLDGAADQYGEAIRRNPFYGKAYYNLGIVLLRQGKPEDAAGVFLYALHYLPNYAEAHNNLGIAYAQLGRRADAMAQFQETLRLNPQFAGARQNLEMLQKQQGDAPRK